eukprot:TRINITY_DN808_c0_g3_i1.p1 TRINITY_DN808_c0_g3~~TRINITY_DN808_c0_g3_i1.p1  ORF type:complete len:405 (-),score=71.76 TRINITY_DN808_c0_g3_i1:48-1262(-)
MSLLVSCGLVRPLDSFLDRQCLRNPASRNDHVGVTRAASICNARRIMRRQSNDAHAQCLTQGVLMQHRAGRDRSPLIHKEFLGHVIESFCQPPGLSFKDQGHVQYYGTCAARCGKSEKADKQAKKVSRKSGKRSAAKGVVLETETLQDISAEAAQTVDLTDEKAMLRQVLKELQKVTSELKALRKAQEKAAKCDSSSSSSSSSESSGSEMEAEDMRKTRASVNISDPVQMREVMPSQNASATFGLPEPDTFAAELRAFVEKGSIHPLGSSLPAVFGTETLQTIATLGIQTQQPAAALAVRGGTVEVCMSGKCRRDHGAQQLLAAFQSRTPESSGISASSCKCLGKCGKGANVRVRPEDTNSTVLSYVEHQDVPSILSRHFGSTPSNRPLPTLNKPAPQVATVTA